MNSNAERHIIRAAGYIAKGDEFYRKAKPEIDAAYAEGATQEEIAKGLAMYGTVRSRKWVSEVLAWDGTGTLYGNDTARRQIDQAKQVLRESTPGQIADIIDSDSTIQSNIEAAVETTYTRRREALRPESGDGISAEQYGQIGERMGEVPENYVLIMREILLAGSKLKVAGVEKVVASADVQERREWAERLPELVDLLQLATDLAKTRELKAVTNG